MATDFQWPLFVDFRGDFTLKSFRKTLTSEQQCIKEVDRRERSQSPCLYINGGKFRNTHASVSKKMSRSAAYVFMFKSPKTNIYHTEINGEFRITREFLKTVWKYLLCALKNLTIFFLFILYRCSGSNY